MSKEKIPYKKADMHRWLCDLNNALNVMRENNYEDFSIGYAESIHRTYHKEIKAAKAEFIDKHNQSA